MNFLYQYVTHKKDNLIIKINNINNANNTPFTLFDGVNVLESKQFAIDICGHYVGVCKKLDIPFIFKGSFD